MDFQNLQHLDKQFIANTYNRFQTDIAAGNGAKLISSSGKEYVDFASGIAVNTFGVNDEAWKQASDN